MLHSVMNLCRLAKVMLAAFLWIERPAIWYSSINLCRLAKVIIFKAACSRIKQLTFASNGQRFHVAHKPMLWYSLRAHPLV